MDNLEEGIFEGREAATVIAVTRCRTKAPGSSYCCWLPAGHEGEHEAHLSAISNRRWSGDTYPVRSVPKLTAEVSLREQGETP